MVLQQVACSCYDYSMKGVKILKLGGAIVVPLMAGFIGNFATSPNIPTWYAALDKPALTPPNAMFGPVWTTLYILIGISLFLVMEAKSDKDKLSAYVAFGTQIALNTLWSLMFFGLRQPWFGVIIIVGLIAAIIWNIVAFRPFSKTASLLLAPYLAWVLFATYLTVGVAVLN